MGTPKFGPLSSINRIAGWGNTFVSSIYQGTGGRLQCHAAVGTGYALPHESPPGSGGAADLVQSADDDVLIAQLGSMGQPATPLSSCSTARRPRARRRGRARPGRPLRRRHGVQPLEATAPRPSASAV